MNRRDERELNLGDMFWYICQKWRIFLVWALVFALAFGVFGYYRSSKSVDADKLEEKLSEEDRIYIDMYLTYKTLCKTQKDYNTYSPLMKLQPNNFYVDVMVFYVDNHYSVEYPVIDENNNISALVQAYKTNLHNDEILDKIVEELNMDARSKAYVGELIDLKNSYSDVTGNQGSDNLIILSIYGNTEEECKKIEAIIAEAIETDKTEMIDKFGEHDVTLFNEPPKKVSNIDLSAYQKKNIDNLYSYSTALTASEGNLSKAALDYVDIVKPVDEDNIEEKEETSPISIKLILIGFILGILLVLVYEALKYVINRELRFEDDYETIFGIKLLGAKVEKNPAKGRWFGFIDRWLTCKRRKHIHIFSSDELIGMVSANIKLLAKKMGISRVYITGVSVKDISEDILDNLIKRLEKEGITIKTGESIIYNSASLEEAEKAGCIVIAEKTGRVTYQEMYSMLDTCEALNIKVLGGIVVE